MILSSKRITKSLIRLRGCAGWSATLLFANLRRQVFMRRGPYRGVRNSISCSLPWQFSGHVLELTKQEIMSFLLQFSPLIVLPLNSWTQIRLRWIAIHSRMNKNFRKILIRLDLSVLRSSLPANYFPRTLL